MTTSMRSGLVVLAILSLQVGCCSVQMDYQGPHCVRFPITLEQGCHDTRCESPDTCQINGIANIGRSVERLRGRAITGLTCGSGCGEIYWDERINEPPVCDPCRCDNQWVGGNGYHRPWFLRMRDLWGYPYIAPDCVGCGEVGICSDCGHHSTGGPCSHCESGIHGDHGHVTEILSSEASVIDATPSREADGVPTPAKPKGSSGGTPENAVPGPKAKPDQDAGGGRTAKAKGSSQQLVISEMPQTESKSSAKPASTRRKLTTKTK